MVSIGLSSHKSWQKYRPLPLSSFADIGNSYLPATNCVFTIMRPVMSITFIVHNCDGGMETFITVTSEKGFGEANIVALT